MDTHIVLDAVKGWQAAEGGLRQNLGGPVIHQPNAHVWGSFNTTKLNGKESGNAVSGIREGRARFPSNHSVSFSARMARRLEMCLCDSSQRPLWQGGPTTIDTEQTDRSPDSGFTETLAGSGEGSFRVTEKKERDGSNTKENNPGNGDCLRCGKSRSRSGFWPHPRKWFVIDKLPARKVTVSLTTDDLAKLDKAGLEYSVPGEGQKIIHGARTVGVVSDLAGDDRGGGDRSYGHRRPLRSQAGWHGNAAECVGP